MTTDTPRTAAGQARLVLVYLLCGVATFAVVSAWVFAGLTLWGRD